MKQMQTNRYQIGHQVLSEARRFASRSLKAQHDKNPANQQQFRRRYKAGFFKFRSVNAWLLHCLFLVLIVSQTKSPKEPLRSWYTGYRANYGLRLCCHVEVCKVPKLESSNVLANECTGSTKTRCLSVN